MDFKTGHPQDKDAEQIRAYGAVIQAMGTPHRSPLLGLYESEGNC